MLRIREVGKEVAVPLNSAGSPSGSRPLRSVFFCNESPPVLLSAISTLSSWKAEVFYLSCGQVPIRSRVAGRREEGGYFML